MNALLRVVAWALALALVALPIVAVVNGWIGAERWPLRTLRISGSLKRVDPQRLRVTVLPYAQQGFFAVRLADARIAAAKIPWVERAEVRKTWPDVLEVRIVEHKPFARWGDDRLLSEHSRLFPIGQISVPKDLPRFDAPESRIRDVVALYNEARTMFTASGFDVRALAVDKRGSWSLTLSNGTQVVIGSSEPRLRLSRFARLVPQLIAQQPTSLMRADLRYTNGFALAWNDRQPSSVSTPVPNLPISIPIARNGQTSILVRLAQLRLRPRRAFSATSTFGFLRLSRLANGSIDMTQATHT